MRRESGSIPALKADPSWKIGIVASEYYKEEMDALVEGAIQVLIKAGIPTKNIARYAAPGSFEIPLIGQWVAEKGEVDALMAFGIIVEGETHHAELLARETTRGIMKIQLQFGIPFTFEVLYSTLAQARERCFGESNKGVEAASALLAALTEKARI